MDSKDIRTCWSPNSKSVASRVPSKDSQSGWKIQVFKQTMETNWKMIFSIECKPETPFCLFEKNLFIIENESLWLYRLKERSKQKIELESNIKLRTVGDCLVWGGMDLKNGYIAVGGWKIVDGKALEGFLFCPSILNEKKPKTPIWVPTPLPNSFHAPSDFAKTLATSPNGSMLAVSAPLDAYNGKIYIFQVKNERVLFITCKEFSHLARKEDKPGEKIIITGTGSCMMFTSSPKAGCLWAFSS